MNNPFNRHQIGKTLNLKVQMNSTWAWVLITNKMRARKNIPNFWSKVFAGLHKWMVWQAGINWAQEAKDPRHNVALHSGENHWFWTSLTEENCLNSRNGPPYLLLVDRVTAMLSSTLGPLTPLHFMQMTSNTGDIVCSTPPLPRPLFSNYIILCLTSPDLMT